jgi:hypothetical protein
MRSTPRSSDRLRVLRSNPTMLDRIAQLGKGFLQLLIGRFRNLLRKPLDKILPILVREDRLE